MKVYLVRHGSYAPIGPKQIDSLTPTGVAEIEALGQCLAPLNLGLHSIGHSGRTRAMETADILSRHLKVSQTKTIQGIDPHSDPQIFANNLLYERDDLMIVSHLPFLSSLASELILEKPQPEIVNFNTGTCVCLEKVGNHHFVIQWVLNKSLYIAR